MAEEKNQEVGAFFSPEFYSKTDSEIKQDDSVNDAPSQTEEERQTEIEHMVEAGDFEKLCECIEMELSEQEDCRGMVESLKEAADTNDESCRIWCCEMLVWTADMARYIKGIEDGSI